MRERHYTVDKANALLPSVEGLLRRLREAKEELTDAEAHELLSDAAPTNGGGESGRQVGEAFLKVRGMLGTLEEAGIVVRDIDRGLIDFPAIRDGARGVPLLGAGRGADRALARDRGRLPR